jgi:tetratricopeptide (TPR) repeat protein
MRFFIFLSLLLPITLIAQEDIKHYNEGVKAQNANDYETAIKCYKKCLLINSKNKDAQTNIGISYYNQSLDYYNKKHYEESIESNNNALKYDPKNSSIYYIIGACHQEQKKYKEAIVNYTKAIGMSSKPASLYSARAWVYSELHDHKSSLSDMEKAVEHEPDNAQYQYWCGKTKQEIGTDEFKTALKNYNKAIELKPDYKDAYTERAAYYMTFQKFKKALPDLAKAKELGADVDHLIEAAKFEMEMQK